MRHLLGALLRTALKQAVTRSDAQGMQTERSARDPRASPQRLFHPRCFADVQGVDALVGLVHAHDLGVREAEYRHWRASHGIQ